MRADAMVEPSQFRREGHGLNLQFFCMNEEMADWLRQLPKDFGPYTLLSIEQNQISRDVYVQKVKIYSFDDLCELINNRLQHRFWICSEHITDIRRVLLHTSPDALCAINGLINLRCGPILSHNLKHDCSSISMVDHIVSTTNKLSIRHKDYKAVFQSLTNTILPALRYSTFSHFADETTSEDLVQRMTLGAYTEAIEGRVIYTKGPGRLISTNKI